MNPLPTIPRAQTLIVAALLALGLTPRLAAQTTAITFESQAGDYIGGGQNFSYGPADGTITARRSSNGVTVTFEGNNFGPRWDLSFVAPQSAVLVGGPYEGALRYPFQGSALPGLDVSGNGRGCNTLTGRFVILEAVYGAGGAVQSFAAEYEQHCEGGPAALFGSIRFNSTVAFGRTVAVSNPSIYESNATVVNPVFTVSITRPSSIPVTVQYATADGTAHAGSDYLAASGTLTFPPGTTSLKVPLSIVGDTAAEGSETVLLSLSNAVGATISFGQGTATILDDDVPRSMIYFKGQAGDYIFGNNEQILTPLDGGFSSSSASNRATVNFSGGDHWTLEFVAPKGAVFAPGNYEGAARYPFQNANQPGLSISGAGRGCNTLSGRFVVREATFGAGGSVVTLAVDFEQHCEGGQPALFGAVRINSSVPLPPTVSIDDPSIAEGGAGEALLAFSVSLSQASSSDVTVNYVTANGTAIAGSDFTAANRTFVIPAGSTSKRFTVLVHGDAIAEADESLSATIAVASGGIPGKTLGIGIILNDDPSAAATPMTQYRLYSPVTFEHLYTTDLNEYTVLGTHGWTQEGVAYQMLSNGVYSGVSTVPLFRLYHPGVRQHHWTTDSNEASVLAHSPSWFYEGTVGYVLPDPVSGATPLYRMALANPALHLWTVDLNEYDTLATRGWVKEGIVGYVIP